MRASADELRVSKLLVSTIKKKTCVLFFDTPHRAPEPFNARREQGRWRTPCGFGTYNQSKTMNSSNYARLVAVLGLLAQLCGVASQPTWRYADYVGREITTGSCGTMTGCVRKTWTECWCEPCRTNPTGRSGQDGCNCRDIPGNPTQVQVFKGRCLSLVLACPKSPCPRVNYCAYPSTPSGAVERLHGCDLATTR